MVTCDDKGDNKGKGICDVIENYKCIWTVCPAL